MACEVVCLKVPEVLHIICDPSHDLLGYLLSFLNTPAPLPAYKAYYFTRVRAIAARLYILV